MINRIIEFSDKNRYLILLLALVAILLGWRSMRETKLDAIPDLSETQVIVYAKWDRSPEIMEAHTPTSDTPTSISSSTKAPTFIGRVRARWST
jgi:Cu/Ag efflux pump CusA